MIQRPERIPVWQEVESEVHDPGRRRAFIPGIALLLIAAIGFGAIEGIGPLVIPLSIARTGMIVFAVSGGVLMAWAGGRINPPSHVRHAALGVLPNVPTEPVVLERSVLHRRLTHELVEEPDEWQFRPVQNHRRNDVIFLFGFGIPFLIAFAGVLSSVFHHQLNLGGWPLSILCGVTVTALCGGSAFLLIGMLMLSGHRRLCRLIIPRNGDDLRFDLPGEPELKNSDLAVELKRFSNGDTRIRRTTIPRDQIVAIQLCPWTFVLGSQSSDITRGVQGLLVLKSADEREYVRYPILLTRNAVRAASLMQRLAATLNVPYLFCADADGWKAEELRATSRQPLQSGGVFT